MDVDRRHDTPESETKKLITHSKASSMSIVLALISLAPPPQSYPRETQNGFMSTEEPQT